LSRAFYNAAIVKNARFLQRGDRLEKPINALRKHLVTAEKLLHQKVGRA
jgi:hypothetical protein